MTGDVIQLAFGENPVPTTRQLTAGVVFRNCAAIVLCWSCMMMGIRSWCGFVCWSMVLLLMTISEGSHP